MIGQASSVHRRPNRVNNSSEVEYGACGASRHRTALGRGLIAQRLGGRHQRAIALAEAKQLVKDHAVQLGFHHCVNRGKRILISPTAIVPLALRLPNRLADGRELFRRQPRSGRPRIANSCLTHSVNSLAGGTRPRSHDSSRWVCAFDNAREGRDLADALSSPRARSGGLPTALIVRRRTAHDPVLGSAADRSGRSTPPGTPS